MRPFAGVPGVSGGTFALRSRCGAAFRAAPSRGLLTGLPARLRTATPRAVAVAKRPTRPRRFRARLVDGEASTTKLVLVEFVDRALRLFIRAHFHECEAASAARRHVADDLHRFHGSG